jgi:hypothetical protein
VRENRTLRVTWRELETWPWWNCEPTEQSKELGGKPLTYSARASSRPYRRGAWGDVPEGNAPCAYPVGMWKKQLCDRTPARTHTVKSLRCAPICSADGCAALDRVRFGAGVKVSAPEGCQPSCLTRGMQGGHRPNERLEAMGFHVVDTIRCLHAVCAAPIP